ncbi:Phosphoglucomutase-3 [Modicella reniformis]|uniref:Phosphoglucomutase-3 n=1 Tax=Modicella reniformis TaxID=1440133 RepID=A0A9P6SV88_9FUNG|nr:Phosphoglucomutase-3 [Modicella reniformis]
MTVTIPISDLVDEWLRLDQNPETIKEIKELKDANNIAVLEARLRNRLRAAMEAGFSRMNDLTVIQASQGLCLHVLEHVQNAKERGVVIGHDHRHHSKDFARLTAGVFLSKGVKVYAYKDLVYWENACQIIPPHDEGIAQKILENLNPWVWDYDSFDQKDNQKAKELWHWDSRLLKKPGASIVLANDPDADRFTVAEKQDSGEWILFTGNQIGTMFACNALENWRASGKSDAKVAMLCSTVSSTMLAKVAKTEGIHWEDTLTGFKWIGNRAIDLEKEGYDVIFGYEEAIGFMLGDIVRDKDGVSALGCFAQLAAKLYNKGIKISSYMDSLYQKYGYFVSANSYFICHEQETIRGIFDKMRFGVSPQSLEETSTSTTTGRFAYKPMYPSHIGSYKVANVRDLTLGYDTSKKDGVPTLPVSSAAEMITFYLENGCVFTLRTSGTEPKIKYYLEVSALTMQEAESQAKEIEAAMCAQLLEPEVNGLQYRASA